MSVDTKELSVVKTQSTKALQVAEQIEVTDADTYAAALDLGKKIKQVDKMITARKEEITKPLNEALKSSRELFKPIEATLEKAEQVVKGKMIAYTREQNRIADEQKAKIATKVETGKMSVDTAMKKMEKIEVPEQTVRTETARSTIKMIPKCRIIDESKIPREYLMPDMAKIKTAVVTQRLLVAGVEFYEEESLSIS